MKKYVQVWLFIVKSSVSSYILNIIYQITIVKSSNMFTISVFGGLPFCMRAFIVRDRWTRGSTQKFFKFIKTSKFTCYLTFGPKHSVCNAHLFTISVVGGLPFCMQAFIVRGRWTRGSTQKFLSSDTQPSLNHWHTALVVGFKHILVGNNSREQAPIPCLASFPGLADCKF